MQQHSSWENTVWGSLATLEYGKALRNYTNGTIPVFGTNGQIGYTHNPICNSEGIIIGRKGAYRGVHYSKLPFFVIDTAFFIKPKKSFNIKWAYYALKGYDINSLDSGSAIPSTSREDFYNIPIMLPPLAEQKAIAAVLGSLDDKIDLLHRQNATLERMAETLFRQWFIEEAQEDWEEVSFEHFAQLIKESANPANLNTSTKYVGLEHIDRKSISLERFDMSQIVTSNKYVFKKGDILFGKLRPYFHKVCFAPFNGICSTDIFVIRPKKIEMLPFCLFCFFQKDVIDFADYSSEGTRMPRISWKALNEYKIKNPPTQKIEKFNSICQIFIKNIEKHQQQIKTLEKLRDTLLPKLMSGEVRVRVDE